jgi:hypothetical protein
VQLSTLKNGKSANIEVRARSASGWWSAITSKVPNVVYVFVQFTRDDNIETFYILPKEVVEQVRKEEEKGPKYYVYKNDIAAYEKKWKVIEQLLR